MTKEFKLSIGGAELAFRATERDGTKATIIFLHESFGCIRHWKDFPDRLGEAAGLNTLVYDRQGYGQSDPFTITARDGGYLEKEADVLAEVIAALGLKDVILFGHSDGGSIALIEAAKYPETIRAVITEGAHVFVEDVTLDGIRQAKEAYKHGDLHRRLAHYHGEKTGMVFSMWADTWLNPDYRDWNMEHFLGKIVCPVLVIQGERDEYGSIRQVESIESSISGRAHRLMPPAGHTPHRETAEAVIEAVVKFLSENVIANRVKQS